MFVWYNMAMELEALKRRKQKVKENFDELNGRIPVINEELLRLQGENRLLDELIEQYKEPDTATDESA